MATDWKSTLNRITVAIGTGMLFLARQLLALLVGAGRFVILRAIPATWRWLRASAFPALRSFYLWLPHRRVVVGTAAGIAAIAIVALLARTPETAAPGDPSVAAAAAAAAEPVIVPLSPMEGAPGAAIALGGLAPSRDAPVEVTIGGEPSSAMWLPDGTLQTRVPLYLGPDGWPEVPSKPQVVEVRRNGVLVATSRDGLRVTPLRRAPGETARVQRSLGSIVGAYERIFETLPAQDDIDRKHSRALMKVLRGLVSEGDHSLAAILSGDSPLPEGAQSDLELIDALMASTGTSTSFEALASALGNGPATGGGAATPPAGPGLPMQLALPVSVYMSGARCRGSGKDMELACLMQIQGLLDDLSREFIKPTADAWANFTLLPIGNHPLSATISALMSVTNLVIGKVAPSLLPATLTRFELVIPKPVIRRHHMTESRIIVAARNRPQSITLDDLVDILKSTVGHAVKFENDHVEHLKSFFYRVFDLYQGALRGVDAVRPGTSQSVQKEILVLPAKTWGPIEVVNNDLVTLFSHDESILSSHEGEMEWRGERAGQETVRVMPRTPGDRSKVLVDHTLCWGCTWRGGAFGTDMPESSKRVSVEVAFEASPPRGRAPLDVDLRWKLLPREDGKPEACTIDFGDGTTPEHIADCSRTRSISHTYPHTSRLNADTGGAWVPSIRLASNGAENEAEVFADWEFEGSPEQGQAPLDTRFRWSIPWPGNRKAPSCEFDPGDGSGRQEFDDCLAVTEAEHTFEKGGSFVPALTIAADGAKDTKTAPVSVAREGTCDESLLEHGTWKGQVSFGQARDIWNRRGDEHIAYTMNINIHGEMPESQRDERYATVAYTSTHPQGAASMDYRQESYSGGNLMWKESRQGGTIRPYVDDVSRSSPGSRLHVSLNAEKCTYLVHVQVWMDDAQFKHWSRGKGETSSSGPALVGGATIQGVIDSSASISGSMPIQVDVGDGESYSGRFASVVWEMTKVAGWLDEDPASLGTVPVTWHFEPVD